jgi:hypothetical protein
MEHAFIKGCFALAYDASLVTDQVISDRTDLVSTPADQVGHKIENLVTDQGSVLTQLSATR